MNGIMNDSTFYGEVRRRLLLLRLARVLSGILQPDAADDEPEDAVIGAQKVVLRTLEDLHLVLVPANLGRRF